MKTTENAIVAPTGRILVAAAVGPVKSATWCIAGSDGAPEGIAADLGRELARRLGLPTQLITYASSGAIVEDAPSGKWDVAFVPADARRKAQVAFGPNFFLGESTFLVAADKNISSLAEIDRDGLTAGGIAETATIRSATSFLNKAGLVAKTQLDDLVAAYEAGEVDALALGRESLMSLARNLKRRGLVLAESFHAAGSALCTPPDRPAAAGILGRLLEDMKADGTVRRFFDAHGLTDAPVAPSGSHP